MLEIASIFKNKVPDPVRLLAYGFTLSENEYRISYDILDNQFQMNIFINSQGEVSVQVIDIECQEEYVLVHTSSVEGGFVGSVIAACEEKLATIADFCFDVSVFRSEQAKSIITYVEQKYQDHLEFLWAKFSGNAVYRRQDNQKWYAVMLSVSKVKLGLAEDKIVEVLDLRGSPEEIAELIDGKHYFPGYHMNKKHWYTICLDGPVELSEIYERIEKSYSLAKK